MTNKELREGRKKMKHIPSTVAQRKARERNWRLFRLKGALSAVTCFYFKAASKSSMKNTKDKLIATRAIRRIIKRIEEEKA